MVMSLKLTTTLVFVLLVVVLDTAGFGLIFPVLPELLKNLVHADTSTAARYGGWLSFAYAAMQFVFAPLLGNLSDRYGRRPVLLVSLLGFSVDCLFLAFSGHILWIFIGRILAGISGASYSVAAATVADISTEENRTRNFGLINAAFGLGFIVGPAIGGVLAQFGTSFPFVVAAILSFLNFSLGLLFFKESLKTQHRRRFSWQQANPLAAMKSINKVVLLRMLMLSIVFVTLANHSMETVWAYFTIEKFHWNQQRIGYSLAFIGGLSVLVQAWLLGLLSKRVKDHQLAIIGLCLTISGFILLAFAQSQWLLFVALFIFILGSLQGTALQSIAAASVPENEQGALQGILGAIMGLTTMVGPLIFSFVFSYTTAQKTGFYFPGAAFVLAAILTVGSLLLLFFSFGKRKKQI